MGRNLCPCHGEPFEVERLGGKPGVLIDWCPRSNTVFERGAARHDQGAGVRVPPSTRRYPNSSQDRAELEDIA